MSNDNKEGLIPEKEVWLEWCLKNPIMFKDDEFVQVLFEQFSGAAIQLERLANHLKVAPLDLTLRDLIDAYERWFSSRPSKQACVFNAGDPKEKECRDWINLDLFFIDLELISVFLNFFQYRVTLAF